MRRKKYVKQHGTKTQSKRNETNLKRARWREEKCVQCTGVWRKILNNHAWQFTAWSFTRIAYRSTCCKGIETLTTPCVPFWIYMPRKKNDFLYALRRDKTENNSETNGEKQNISSKSNCIILHWYCFASHLLRRLRSFFFFFWVLLVCVLLNDCVMKQSKKTGREQERERERERKKKDVLKIMPKVEAEEGNKIQ